MKLQWVLAGLGIAMVGVSAYASGGDLPAAVPAAIEVKASVARETAPVVVAPRPLDGFSPGNRLIAQALYSAQKVAAANGRQPWSLERVAASRVSGGNWGLVFRQMKEEGLLEAETLGQVVTWYQYHQVVPAPANRNVPASLVGVKAAQPLPAPAR